MSPSQATKKFLAAFKKVRKDGVKIFRRGIWGVSKNGKWHTDNLIDQYHGSGVCACGALVLALQPSLRRPKNTEWCAEEVLNGTAEALGITYAQAEDVSNGFEGYAVKGGEEKWYLVGKSLRRHADRKVKA